MNDIAKDTTLKVTVDVKDTVNQIGTELGGKTQREVVEYLIGLHHVKQDQEGGRAIPAWDKLHYHFSRIEDMYTEWVRATWDLEEKYAAERSHWQTDLSQTQQALFALRAQWEQVSAESAKTLQDVQAEAQSIREQAVIEVEEMKRRLTQAQLAQDQAAQLARLAQTAAEDAKQRADTLEVRVLENDQLTHPLREAFAQLAATEQELARLQEKMPLEIDRATLAVERQSMALIAELRESLAAAREDNARLQIQLAQR